MEFVIVGGVSAVLQGAPIATFDLDIVHRRTPDNLDRLLGALRELRARYRDAAGRGPTPDLSHLRSTGHQLLITRAGPLDVLGTIEGGRSYEELLPSTVEISVKPGLD